MTRHYYHENLDALRSAVASIPVIGKREEGKGKSGDGVLDTSLTGLTGLMNVERNGAKAARTPAVELSSPIPHPSSPIPPARREGVPARLRRIDRYLAEGLISEAEHAAARQRILAEM